VEVDWEASLAVDRVALVMVDREALAEVDSTSRHNPNMSIPHFDGENPRISKDRSLSTVQHQPFFMAGFGNSTHGWQRSTGCKRIARDMKFLPGLC
jgi:hypothetical protein